MYLLPFSSHSKIFLTIQKFHFCITVSVEESSEWQSWTQLWQKIFCWWKWSNTEIMNCRVSYLMYRKNKLQSWQLLLKPWSGNNNYAHPTEREHLKARSHGAFFFCAFAMQKMDYVGVNEGVHMVWFQVRAMHWCVQCHKQLGSIPILCVCECVVWNRCNWYL